MSSSAAMLGRFGTTDEDVRPEMNLKNEITQVVTSFCLAGQSRALVTSGRKSKVLAIVAVL